MSAAGLKTRCCKITWVTWATRTGRKGAQPRSNEGLERGGIVERATQSVSQRYLAKSKHLSQARQMKRGFNSILRCSSRSDACLVQTDSGVVKSTQWGPRTRRQGRGKSSTHNRLVGIRGYY